MFYLHELIKGPFSTPILDPYVVALKTEAHVNAPSRLSVDGFRAVEKFMSADFGARKIVSYLVEMFNIVQFFFKTPQFWARGRQLCEIRSLYFYGLVGWLRVSQFLDSKMGKSSAGNYIPNAFVQPSPKPDSPCFTVHGSKRSGLDSYRDGDTEADPVSHSKSRPISIYAAWIIQFLLLIEMNLFSQYG